MHTQTWLVSYLLLSATAWAEGPSLLAEVTGSGVEFADQFGYSAALGDRVAAFGAIYDDDAQGDQTGAVYVFEESADGAWFEAKKIDGRTAGDWFGIDVDIDGHDLVVSSLAERVYLLERSKGAWTHGQTLKASDGAPTFGAEARISGHTIVVGARYRNGDVGGAYVFERDPATNVWSESDILVPMAAIGGSEAGKGVDVDGDVVAVLGDGLTIFERDPMSGAFVETAQLTPADGNALSEAVAVSGDTVIAGSMWAGGWLGYVYVFERDPLTGAWSETQRLEDPDPASDGNFGSAVRIDGDVIAVGAHAVYGARDGGTATVFRKEGGTWFAAAKVLPPELQSYNNFGLGLGLFGDRLAIGARSQLYAGVEGGAGYLFDLVPTEIILSVPMPGQTEVKVTGLTPHGSVVLFQGDVLGVRTLPHGPCVDTDLALSDAHSLESGATDPWGTAVWTLSDAHFTAAYVQAMDRPTCGTSDPAER